MSIFNASITKLQIINHTIAAVGISLLVLEYVPVYYAWITLVFYLLFEMVGTNIGMHRYFSHRSFKTYRPIELILALLATLSTVGSIVGWCGLHRYHHKHSDTELDPHNPYEIGIVRAWTYDWKRSNFNRSYIAKELKDPALVWLHRNYFKTIFIYCGILAIIDPMLIIFCYCIPACGSYLAISAVTVIGHMHGYINTKVNDTAKNSWITCLLSCGEGWHNNHHAKPGAWNNRVKWWEFDPNALIIRVIKK